MIWLLPFLGCVAHLERTGLVLQDEDRVHLVSTEGQETRLVLEGDARAIRSMGGCTVRLSGQRTTAGVRVDDWEVKDAGFGSQPFVGRLQRVGTDLYLKDRTTKTTLRLEANALRGLENAVGGIVLIEGVIVGGHVLKVVTWRGLLAPDAIGRQPG